MQTEKEDKPGLNNKSLKIKLPKDSFSWINYEDWKAYEDFMQRKKIEALPKWLIKFLYENTNREENNNNT